MSDIKKSLKLPNVAQAAVAKSFRDFKTVSVADSKDAKMPIVIPGHGDTGHVLYVKSQYCSDYRAAQLKAQRQLLALMAGAGEDGVDEELRRDINMRALATLVSGWTFDEKPEPELIVEFLQENPTVYDDLNMFAANDANFF
ncbi:tail assembly chaperone [Hafnia phage yong3]|nr:tail assembly chaperone [Hafnia phage yong3]